MPLMRAGSQPSGFMLKVMRGSPRLRENLNTDLIEPRHAVGFGPQRDAPGTRQGSVAGGMKCLAIEDDGEPVVLGFQAEAVPLARGDLDVGGRQLLAASFDDAIEADIVLQRIRAHE